MKPDLPKTMKVVSLDIETTILQGKDQWRDDLRGEWRSVPPSLFGKLAKDVLPRCAEIRGYDARLSNAVHPCRWESVYGMTKP